MAVVNYYSHVPTIRMADEVQTLGPGQLWRLPFETWNAQTGGAFEDHEDAYEATAPVFFFLEVDLDWPTLVAGEPVDTRLWEAKIPNHAEDDYWRESGLGFMKWFVDVFGWNVQATVSLAAPASAPGSLRSSVTLCAPDDGFIFRVDERDAVLTRVQGDADHEWLLLPEASGPALPTETVDFASALWPFVDAARESDDLKGPIGSLLLCAEPTLAAREQLLLAATALEALLLPELRSDLKARFAARLATLLSASEDPEQVEYLARVFYDTRTAALHGFDPKDKKVSELATRGCGPQQLLAAAILALGPSVLNGVPLDETRDRLDAGEPPEDGITVEPIDIEAPYGLRSDKRLGHSSPTSAPMVLGPDSVMHAPEGRVASWSPLLGLACDETLTVDEGDFAIVSLNPIELVEIEERDIKSDFIGNLRAQYGLGQVTPDAVACIGLFDEGQYDIEDLEQRRILAVAALRLAGFSDFIDPKLLGWYVFEGMQRYRYPTILRQSIFSTMTSEPSQRIASSDLGRVGTWSELLVAYHDDHRNAQIDRFIAEFLSAHPTRFLPSPASAGLLFGTLEGILGRFRPRAARIQLEDLVGAIVADADAEWFSREGRAYRNDIAHGRWSGDGANLQALLSVVREVLGSLIGFWVALADPSLSPPEAFVRDIEHSMA